MNIDIATLDRHISAMRDHLSKCIERGDDVSLGVEQGVTRVEDYMRGVVRFEPNGTRTYTFRVWGGSSNHVRVVLP